MNQSHLDQGSTGHRISISNVATSHFDQTKFRRTNDTSSVNQSHLDQDSSGHKINGLHIAISHNNTTEPGYIHKVTNEGRSRSQEVETENGAETYKMIPNETTTKGSDRKNKWPGKNKVKIKRQKTKILSSHAHMGRRKITPNGTTIKKSGRIKK